MENNKLKKEIGLFIATALVVGNMMGSGVFMLPSTLAQVGGVGTTILAWILTGLGSMVLALTCARLGSKIPKSGGLYEYSRLAFGEFAGFISAWLYWNGSWIGNATIIIVVVTYLSKAFPILNNNAMIGFLFSSLLLWIFTIINIRGTKFAGKVSTYLTVFKMALFIFFLVLAGLNFDSSNLTPAFPEGKGLNTLPLAAAATLWAFTGLETAAVTSGEIKNPEKNVKRSTILGMLVATLLYLLISIFAMGASSQEALASSSAPIVDIIARALGGRGMRILAVAIALSISGTAMGWVLSTARVAYAAGEDEIFPKVFSKLHKKYNTPYVALIIGSILVNLTFLLNFTKGLVGAYNFVVLLATLSYLPIYALSSMAEIVILCREKQNITFGYVVKNYWHSIVGFIFSLFAIVSSGAETVMYGFLLLLIGIPIHVFLKIRKKSEENLIDIDVEREAS